VDSSSNSSRRERPASHASGTWETYLLLADCLQRCVSGAPKALPASVHWKGLVEAASHHVVTPALSWCLRSESQVPDDLRRYLKTIAALNRERNALIHDTLVAALRALNRADIAPLLLKGIASLESGLYPDASLRVLADIDFLVPLERAAVAHALLLDAGFVPAGLGTGEEYPEQYHHLPALRHPDTGIAVELHRRVLVEAYDRLVPAASLLNGATAVLVDGCAARLPSPTDRFVHALAHTQLQDANFGRGTPELRQLLELAMLTSRYRGEIDWPEVVRRFRAAGQLAVLQETCAIVARLFGAPAPDAVPEPDRDPLDRLRRRLQRRVALPTPLLWSVLHTVRTRPAKLLELLNPRKLAEHLSRVPGYLKQSRWK
jgi:hypothetical protein